jgi:VanZ family protein
MTGAEASNMSVVSQPQDAGSQATRIIFWGIALALWTAGLLTSYPVQVSQQGLPPAAGFPAAKLLHIVAYAGLCGLIPWLGVSARWRWGLLALLSLHAGGTEFLQTFVPMRTGSVADVGIDHVGLLLGASFTWRGWRQLRRDGQTPAVAGWSVISRTADLRPDDS